MADECKSRERLLEELKALRLELAKLQDARQEQDRRILEIQKYYGRFRQACLASRDSFGDWDIVNDSMWCGEGMQASLGVPERIGNVFNWLVQIIHPEDRERMTLHLKQLLDSDQVWDESEFRVLTGQGAYKDIIFRTFLTRDEDGKPLRMIGLAADNSRRKKMEAELRQSGERYRTIIENMEDGYHEVNLKGNFLFFNNACAVNLGCAPEEMTGVSAYSVLPDEQTVRKVEEACGDVLRTGGRSVRRVEHDILRKDGLRRTIECSISLIRDESGRPSGFRGVSRDTTERKRAEEELKKYADEISDLYHNAPCGYHSLNTDGVFVKINDTELLWLGYAREEIVGKKRWTDLLTPEGIVTYEKTFPVLKKKGRIDNVEIDILRKDGSSIPVLLNATAVSDESGNFIMSRATLFDMTERRRTEAELRKSEEKYRTIIESMEDGYFEIDLKGNYTFVNEALCKKSGRSREELLGMNNRIYTLPEQAGRARKMFKHMYETGKAITIMDYDVIDKNGAVRTLDVTASPIFDSSGKPVGARGIGRDVTERKRMEEEREKISERLNHSQKMEAIGTLAGGIAHDFNNILASIMGSAELIRLRSDQPGLDPYLDRILKSCDRAKDLVNQILTFGQQKERETKEINLNDLMADVVKLLRATLPVTIEIRRNLEAKPHYVLADPTEIHQIFMNLSANSAYAMRTKGGFLELTLRNISVDSRNAGDYPDLKPGTYVELGIRDNGEGIDPVNIGRIFDPFYTTKERGKATGLGLAVVYGIVKEYGGNIAVRSERGKGAVFSIYLPSIEPEPEVVKIDESIPGGSESVLFVDDEESLAFTGVEMLRHLGYDAVGATNSREALDIFRENPDRFDLVITDLTMPNLTGIDFAKELMKIRPGLPIILSTGYSELITEEESKKIGIREFFMKPYSLEQMAQGIRRALKQASENACH